MAMMDLVNKYSPKSEGGMMSLVDKYDPKKKKVKKKEEAPAAKQVPLKPEYDILNDVAPTKKTVEKKTNVVNEKTNPAMLKKNQVNEKTNPLMLRPSKDTPAESLNKMVVGGLKDSVRPDMELYRPLSGKTKIDAPKPESYSDYKRNQREEVKQDWLRPGRDPINKYIAEPMFQGFDAASGLVESLTTPASDLKDKSVGGYLKNVATNLDKDLKEISPHNHIPGQPVEDEIKIGRGLTGVENAYTAAINAVKSGKPLDQENWTSKSNVLKYDSFDSMPPDVKASYVASFGDNNTAANVQTELNRLRSVGFVDQQANELLGLPLGMPMAKVSMFPIETLEQGYKTYTAKKKWNLSKIGNTVGGLAFDMVLPVGGLTAPGKAVAQTGLAIAKGTGKLATALPGVRNIPRIGAAAKEAKLIEDMRNAFAVKNGIQDALAGARTETVGGMQIANPKAPVAKTRPGSGFKLDAEGNPVAKEIHEMTVGEFRSLDHTLTGKNGGKTTIRYTEKRNLTSAERAINEKIDSAHADAVAKAYKSGKYVPDEVLSEYGLVQKQNVKGRIPQEQQLSRVEREYTQALETLNNKYQNPDLKGTIREIDPSVHWLDYIRDNDGIDLRKLMYEMDKYQNLDSYIEMSAKYTREELVKEITATRNNIAKLQKEAKVAKDSQDYEQLQKLYSAIDENTDTMNTFQIMLDNKRVVEPKLKPTKKVKEPTYRGIEPVLNPENAVVEAPGKVRTRQPHEMSFDEFKNQLHDVEMPDGSIKKMRYEAGTTDPLQYKVNQMIKDAHRKAVMDAHWSGKKLPEYVRSEYKLADVSAIPEPEPLPTNETITTGTGKNAEVPLEVTHAHDSQSELASLNRAVAEASSEATNPVIQAVVERGEDIYKPADLKKLDKQKQKQIELINLLAKEYGLDVKFIEPNITAYGELVSPHNGIYHNGTLYINTATKNPLHVAFGHELGEAIKAETPDLYEKFVKVFSEEFRNGTKFADEYIASLKSVTEANAGGTPINAELMAEMANDFIGTQIGNKKFWQIMYDKAPEVAQKFLDTLTDMIRRIKNKITPNMRADKLVNDLERVQNQAAEVLQEFKSRKPLKTGETKFSMNRDAESPIIQKAIDEFGTTNNFREAGYITPSGQMLDFSGKKFGGPKGTRTMDHAEISQIFDTPDERRYRNIYAFMNEGAIRITPESSGLELSRMPTDKQIPRLRRFITDSNGEVWVDFADGSAGYTNTASYPKGTSTDRVLNDIKSFFETGKIRKSDVADFHTKFSVNRDEPTKPFFSKLQRTLQLKMPNSASAQDILNLVTKNGVKPEELKWSELDDYLKENPKANKQDLLDYLKANEIEVKEVKFDDSLRSQSRYGDYTVDFGDNGKDYFELVMTHPKSIKTYTHSHWGDLSSPIAHIRGQTVKAPNGEKVLYIEEIQSDWHQAGRKKGYKDYNEFNKRVNAVDDEIHAIDVKLAKTDRDSLQLLKSSADHDAQKAMKEMGLELDPTTQKLKRQSPFTEEEKSRLQELLNKSTEYQKRLDEANKVYEPLFEKKLELRAERSKLFKELRNNVGVPDAPFKTTWRELATKRAVRYAAENGFDRIAFTRGEDQYARWGSERFDWRKEPDTDAYWVSGKEQHDGLAGGIDLEQMARERGELIQYQGIRMKTKEDVRELIENTMSRDRYNWSEEKWKQHIDSLADRMWERMQAGPEGTMMPRKEGMESFYDKMLPDSINSYVKKWGVKVEPTELATSEGDMIKAPSIRITPEMKESVLYEGQPLFSMNRDGAYLRKNITPDNAHNLTYDEFRTYFRNPTKLKSKNFGYAAAPEEVKAIEQKYYAKTYEVINQFEKELGVPLSKPGENKVASDFLEKLAYDYAKPELAMLRQAQLEESWAAVNKAIEKEYVDMIDAARAKGKTIPPAAQKSYDSIKSGKPQFSMNRFMSMTPPIKKGKSLSEISMKIRESVINEAASLARAEDTIMGTWQKPLDASVSLKKQFALNKGAFSAADMRIKTELEPIIQAAEAKGYTMEDLGKYALAYHQETMLMRATKVNGKPVTFNAPTRTIMDTVQQYKDLEPERRALVEYSQRLLDYMVESGNMKKSFANYLKKKYPDYVPMHYEYADDYMGIATGQLGGYSNAKTPLKRITADPAAAPTINPIESIIKNTYLFENAASRNRVARTLEHLAKRDLLGAYVKEVPNPGNKSNRTNTITAYVDGVKRYFEVDKDMYEVLSGMVKGEALNPLVKILGMPANLLRSGATLAPEFIARNPIRDIVTAFFNSKSGFNPFTDFARGFGSYLAHEGGLGGTVAKKLGADPTLYEGFIRNRGGMGIMAATKRPETWKAAQKLSGKSVGEKIVDYVTVLPKLKKYTAATEYGTRVGEYSRALKKGVSAEEAAFRGRDLIDFSRRGRNMKNVNALYAFLNADIQGKAKTVNTIRDLWKYGTAKEKAMYLTKVIGVSAGLSIAAQNLYHLASEEQRRRIDAVDQRTKDTFWLIPLPFGDQVARIPKSFEYAVVSNVTERMLRQIPREAFLKYFADDSEHVDSGLAGELASVGGFNYTPSRMLPTALVPAVEGIANQSFFWGNDVIPKAEQGLLLEDQKDINTSTAAEVLAKGYRSIPGVGQEYSDGNGVANFGSPRVMDNMIRGYTGGLGTLVSSGIDAAAGIGSEGPKRVAKGAAQKPLLKAFLVNDIAPAPSIQRLYSLKTELEAEKKSADLHGTAFLREGIYDIVKEATDQMGENNKLIKEITNDNSDPKVKLANVKSLKLQNNQIANNYARMLKLLK